MPTNADARPLRTIETYDRLQRHLAAWVAGEIQHLLIAGPGGVGKSESCKAALGNRPHHVFRGRQTPLLIYRTICDAPHLPAVFDDLDALLKDPQSRDLLKSLCELGERTIRWGTTTARLEGRPTSCRVRAPVLIITNSLPSRDPDVEAILDRVDAVRFEPRKAEIIARMRTIFPAGVDQNLITLIEELPVRPSLRTLIKARAWRDSNHLRLIEELYAECGVPEPVRMLTDIMAATPPVEWCQRYVAATGLTDRTFRRHRAIAEQLLECRKAVNDCPNVRALMSVPVNGHEDLSDQPFGLGE